MLTKETIDGNEYNVIWHKPKGWAEALDCDVRHIGMNGGSILLQATYMGAHIATALPALPRHPKPEHARLLHLYAAHGVEAICQWNMPLPDGDEICQEYRVIGHSKYGWRLEQINSGLQSKTDTIEITHLTYNGEMITDFAVEETNEH